MQSASATSGASALTTGGGGVMPPAPPGGTYYAPPSGTVDGAEQYASAQNAYNQALIRYNQQRTGLLSQYGYKGTIDPKTGLMTNVGVDPSNSYGQLQQLLHGQANEDQQADFAAEDRGLVGGLAHQGEQELSYQHHGQSSALANSLLGSLSDLNSQQLDSKTALDQALWQLQHGATTDAIDSGDYNPADLSGLDGSDDGSGGGVGGKSGKTSFVSHIGTVKTSVANALVKNAIAKGQPVSEHGLGQMKSPTRPAAKAAPKKPAPKPARYRGRH